METKNQSQPQTSDGSAMLYFQGHDPESEFGTVVKNWLNTGPRWFSMLMLNPMVKGALHSVSSAGNEIEIWSIATKHPDPDIEIVVNGKNELGAKTSIKQTLTDGDFLDTHAGMFKLTETIKTLNAEILAESSLSHKAQIITKAIEREKASIILSVMPEGKVIERMPFHPLNEYFKTHPGTLLACNRAAQNGIQIDVLSYDAGEYVVRGLRGLESHEMHEALVGKNVGAMIANTIHEIVDFMVKK